MLPHEKLGEHSGAGLRDMLGGENLSRLDDTTALCRAQEAA
jgi:hypothetical protein